MLVLIFVLKNVLSRFVHMFLISLHIAFSLVRKQFCSILELILETNNENSRILFNRFVTGVGNNIQNSDSLLSIPINYFINKQNLFIYGTPYAFQI